MTPWLASLLTPLVPAFPWLGLVPDWVARQPTVGKFWSVLTVGLLMDLWWGKPLGWTSLMIGTVVLVVPVLEKWWPASRISFRAMAILISLIVAEGYLLII